MGKSSCPTVFHRASTGCRCVVHGDDFTFLMLEGEIEELVKNFEKWYEIELRGELGGYDRGQGDQHGVMILNRRLRWRGATME